MNEKISFAIIGLLAGIVLTWLVSVSAVNNQNTGMMRLMGIRNSNFGMMGNLDNDDYGDYGGNMMGGFMANMMQGVQNKTGDSFDQAFLAQMIAHHQGAINMAAQAAQKAKHQEIKDLAKKIISTQSDEIHQMQNWQTLWYQQ